MPCRTTFLMVAALAALMSRPGGGSAQAPRPSADGASTSPTATSRGDASGTTLRSVVDLTLEIRRQMPDYADWVPTITLGVPEAVTFRWSRPTSSATRVAAQAQWQLSLAASPATTVSFLGTGRLPLWTSYGAVSVPAIGSSSQFTIPAGSFPAKPPAGVAWARVVLTTGTLLHASPWLRIAFVEPAGTVLFDEALNRCRETPDGYYRLPFGPGAHWKLMKGNWDEPKYGHNKGNSSGLQAYAFDFAYDADADGLEEVGQPVLAARRGRVHALVETETGNSSGDGNPVGYDGVGNFLVIQHPDGTFGTYWHMPRNSIVVSVGQVVERGQMLAKVGNTGNSSTPHLHFDVRTNWSLAYPGERIEFPSVMIRFQDENNTCWIPRVGDSFGSNNR